MATTASHVWRPSASRVLMLDGFIPGPRGFPLTPPAILQWPAKDPADVLDYQLDIAPALYGNDGDAISTIDVAITPSDLGDLALVSSAADGTRAVVWLQGGKIGSKYSVNLTVGTEAGRQISRSILLPVIAYSAAGASNLPIILEDGSTLVDASGNPIVLNLGLG